MGKGRPWVPQGILRIRADATAEGDWQSVLKLHGGVGNIRFALAARHAGLRTHESTPLAAQYPSPSATVSIAADVLGEDLTLFPRWISSDGTILWEGESLRVQVGGTSSLFPVATVHIIDEWQFMEMRLPEPGDADALTMPWSIACQLLVDPRKDGWKAMESLMTGELKLPPQAAAISRLILAPVLAELVAWFDHLEPSAQELVRRGTFDGGTFGSLLNVVMAGIPTLIQAKRRFPLPLIQAAAASGVLG